jgi:hypothetical protein
MQQVQLTLQKQRLMATLMVKSPQHLQPHRDMLTMQRQMRFQQLTLMQMALQ